MEGLVRQDKHTRKPDVCLFFIRVVGQVREKMTILIQNMSWYQILRPGASQRLRTTGVFQCQKTVHGLCRYSNKKGFFLKHPFGLLSLHRIHFSCSWKMKNDRKDPFFTDLTDRGHYTMKSKWTLMLGALCLVSASVLAQETGASIDTPKKHDIKRWNIFVLKWVFPYEHCLHDTGECD